MLALVAVVGLAKVESPAIEAAVSAAGLPAVFVGGVIAAIVLLPETLAAARNALRDRVQIGLNLAYGSAAASIGLTVPTIALASIWLPSDLILGLSSLRITLLALPAVLGALTALPGCATVPRGHCTWWCAPPSSTSPPAPDQLDALRIRIRIPKRTRYE